MSAKIDKPSNPVLREPNGERERGRGRAPRRLFSVCTCSSCSCKLHVRATFTCLLAPWLIRYPCIGGSATSGGARGIIYTGHFGAPPPRFKPRPRFDYYRLCAINWRLLAAPFYAPRERRPQFRVAFFARLLPSLALDGITMELTSYRNNDSSLPRLGTAVMMALMMISGCFMSRTYVRTSRFEAVSYVGRMPKCRKCFSEKETEVLSRESEPSCSIN